MRIAAVVHRHPPGNIANGASLATAAFLEHLATRGHDVTAVVQLGLPRRTYDHNGVHVVVDQRHVERIVVESDVVIAHARSGPRVIAAAGRRPIVRMVHGHAPNDADLVGAALAVYPSQWLHDAVATDVPSIVCHPPTDIELHATTPGDRVTIVNTSRAKGGDLFDRITRTLPNRQFLACRGGHGIQLEPDRPNVDIVGPTADMARDVWARTRVLLLPSVAESWCMAGIEAMCSGIPVIAHPCAGLRESLGGAGIFVDRDDPKAWIAELERLDDPDEWAEASAQSLARVDELRPELAAGLDRFADAVEALTQSSVEESGRPRPVHARETAGSNPAAATKPRFAVIGTGRSGTGYMAALLGCGHEKWWNPKGHRRLVGAGDSSWLALPAIEAGAHDGPVLHVTRHPVDVVRSLVGIGFFAGTDTRDPRGAYRTFAVEHCPEADRSDPVEAAVEWWVRWNERCTAVANAAVRIEDVTAGDEAALMAVANALGVPTPDPSAVPPEINHRLRSKTTAGRIWRLLDGRAERFGYTP